MDAGRFDGLTRALSQGVTRRSLTPLLGGLALGGTLASHLDSTQAKKKNNDNDKKTSCPSCKKKKDGTCKANKPDGTACENGGQCQRGSCVSAGQGPPPPPGGPPPPPGGASPPPRGCTSQFTACTAPGATTTCTCQNEYGTTTLRCRQGSGASGGPNCAATGCPAGTFCFETGFAQRAAVSAAQASSHCFKLCGT